MSRAAWYVKDLITELGIGAMGEYGYVMPYEKFNLYGYSLYYLLEKIDFNNTSTSRIELIKAFLECANPEVVQESKKLYHEDEAMPDHNIRVLLKNTPEADKALVLLKVFKHQQPLKLCMLEQEDFNAVIAGASIDEFEPLVPDAIFKLHIEAETKRAKKLQAQRDSYSLPAINEMVIAYNIYKTIPGFTDEKLATLMSIWPDNYVDFKMGTMEPLLNPYVAKNLTNVFFAMGGYAAFSEPCLEPLENKTNGNFDDLIKFVKKNNHGSNREVVRLVIGYTIGDSGFACLANFSFLYPVISNGVVTEGDSKSMQSFLNYLVASSKESEKLHCLIRMSESRSDHFYKASPITELIENAIDYCHRKDQWPKGRNFIDNYLDELRAKVKEIKGASIWEKIVSRFRSQKSEATPQKPPETERSPYEISPEDAALLEDRLSNAKNRKKQEGQNRNYNSLKR